MAGAGVKVAKHGNRSVSSLCGSADVVETLGINIELSAAKVAHCVDEVGIGFLYAPLLHTAMKYVMATRREMGIRTVAVHSTADADAMHVRLADESVCIPMSPQAMALGVDSLNVATSAAVREAFSSIRASSPCASGSSGRRTAG